MMTESEFIRTLSDSIRGTASQTRSALDYSMLDSLRGAGRQLAGTSAPPPKQTAADKEFDMLKEMYCNTPSEPTATQMRVNQQYDRANHLQLNVEVVRLTKRVKELEAQIPESRRFIQEIEEEEDETEEVFG